MNDRFCKSDPQNEKKKLMFCFQFLILLFNLKKSIFDSLLKNKSFNEY